ncbi:hypothetical protein CPC08DRAFT_752598 [Agrocybe pediades]|nr:hypothetical protein CPC08DRAFT_752598 [Agrocybe pediades]
MEHGPRSKIKRHDYFAGIEWEQVASKGLDVPLNARAVPNLGQKNFLGPSQKTRFAELVPYRGRSQAEGRPFSKHAAKITHCQRQPMRGGARPSSEDASRRGSYGRGSSEPVTPATLFDSCADAGPLRQSKDSRDHAYGILPKSTTADAEFEDAEANAPG